MPFTHLEIIKIMRGRNLHRSRPLFRVRILIRNHRHKTPNQRQNNMFADQMF